MKNDVRVEDKIVMRPINTIKPYIRNPRKNKTTVEMLCKIIPKVGFNVPLVIDEKGIIVKGHARFFAAIRLGMTEVPCIITHADEDAIRADRITDNKISEFSEWVTDDLIKEINEMQFDLSDIGLPKIDFMGVQSAEDVAEELATPGPEHVEELPMSPNEKAPILQPMGEMIPHYKVVCDKCGYIMFLKESDLDDMEG